MSEPDPGPTAGNASITVGHNQALNETALIDSLVTPGLPGDTETIIAVTGDATLTGQTVIYESPSSGTDSFTYTVEDQLGDTAIGTIDVTIDPGPTITAVTPSVVEKGQSTVIGTVTPGLAGDTLTLQQTGGSGTVSLQLVGGVEEVIYTAPATAALATLATVSYTITDEYDDVASGSSTIPIAPAGDAVYTGTPGGSLSVGNGNSAIDGTGGHENIHAGNGNDAVFAGPYDTIGLGNGSDTVLGGYNDTIEAGNGSDTISSLQNARVTLGNGQDVVIVGGGAVISAGNGTDTVFVGDGSTITLGNGADTVYTGTNIILNLGNGSDYVSGGINDAIKAGNGADVISVGADANITLGNGQDSVTAGSGAVITAGNGADTVSAGSGSSITLGNGADTVIAGTDSFIKLGNGADTIDAASGDTITVGNGHDTFVFGLSPGTTTAGQIGPITINGFNPSIDVIKIASTLASWDSSYAALTASPSHITTDSGGDAVIQLDSSGDTITLMGVRPSSLHAGDFIFA